MKIICFLCALSGLSACLSAADVPSAPLAVYYSFDTPPPPALLTAMQSELARILAPSDLRVTWRAIDNHPSSESFSDVVVLRFHGSCVTDSRAVTPVIAGETLASTELADGLVLPFGQVECDPLRRFLGPVEGNRANKALGRAMARVSAHEIYHMLTRSMQHATSGIARAAHSRTELTASSFSFAKPEQQWLRLWAKHQVAPELTAQAPSSSGVVTLVHDTP